MDAAQLYEYMSMGLEDKIKLSQKIIKKFHNSKCYISSSFGKDSIVMIELIRELYPDTPIVYIDTGIEHESCVELSKNYDNVITIYPKKDIGDIIREYGYMIPDGKDKADAIEQCRRNLHDGRFNTFRVKQFRKGSTGNAFDYSNNVDYLLAPFKISNKCYYWLKKAPIERFIKNNDYDYGYLGLTAEESFRRRNAILKNGFIHKNQCTPIAHWKVNDVLQFIIDRDLTLPSCYGEIIKDENGNYRTSLFQRTGCLCCPISSQYENPNKFQLLHTLDFDTWDYIINELGYGEVLNYFNISYK